MSTTTIKCECGGRFKKAILPRFDFTPYAGFKVMLKQVPGLRCAKCGEETLDGLLVNFVLNLLAFEITKLPMRLNSELARFLRKRLMLTQQELAERMAVDRVTVASWETGTKEISPHNDYILRGLLIEAFVQLGHLKLADVAFTARVRRDPPAPSPELPPAAIAQIVERMKTGGAGSNTLYS